MKGFARTIYDFGERSKGFLDPWSSLEPSFLRQKIAPEILGVFSYTTRGLKFAPFFKIKDGSVDPAQLKDKWVLVFPKRTYLPPDYPHLQLWLLGQNYVPSPKFMSESETKVLGLIMDLFLSLFEKYSKDYKKPGKIAFGYNSTPFSFIKDNLGRYYAGGQSVRAFHLHCLLIPKSKKIIVPKSELALIHPTGFSHQLLRMIFKNKMILKKLRMGDSKRVYKTIRGIKITPFSTRADSLQNLWESIGKADELLYKVQALLVSAFYKDADQFIKKIGKVAQSRDISQVKKILKQLIVVGEERKLGEIKHRLVMGLMKLAGAYQASFSENDLSLLTDQLLLGEKGELSSLVFGQWVVLRPGLGYSCLLEKSGEGKLSLKIQPLDILGSKGLIESSGYWFEKKIIKSEFPRWAVTMVEDLISRFN